MACEVQHLAVKRGASRLAAIGTMVLCLAPAMAQAPRGDVPTFAPPEPSSQAPADRNARLPVMVRPGDQGGLRYIENSGLLAEVSGLKNQPDSFLSVRAGPSVAYREIDRLRAGRKLVPLSPDFEWMGVVYASPQLATAEAIAAACKLDETTAAALAEATPYAGPCKSGWVNRKWVKMLVD
jgi:hypothetical protein